MSGRTVLETADKALYFSVFNRDFEPLKNGALSSRCASLASFKKRCLAAYHPDALRFNNITKR